jgi:hypothetical protein
VTDFEVAGDDYDVLDLSASRASTAFAISSETTCPRTAMMW